MEYEYRAPILFKLGAALFALLGLAFLLVAGSEGWHSRPFAESLGFGLGGLLIAWIFASSAAGERLKIDSGTGRGVQVRTGFPGGKRQREFDLAEVTQIRVWGTINWVSVHLEGVDCAAHRAIPRTEAGKQVLRKLLDDLKETLNKPVVIDPQVAEWFGV